MSSDAGASDCERSPTLASGERQQVDDEDVAKKWRVAQHDRWLDTLGREFSGEVAGWAASASNQQLEQVANLLLALRFSKT